MAKFVNISSWSVDDWYWAWSVFSVIFLVGTVVAAIGTVWTGKILNANQSREILALRTDLAKAKTAQADSEIKLDEVRKRQEPRQINQKFVDALKDKPSAAVEILYPSDDGEAFKFALNIALCLPKPWKMDSVRAISPTDGTRSWKASPIKNSLPGPPALRVGGQPTGVSIVGNTWLDGHSSVSPITSDTPYGALVTAFGQSGIFVGPGSKDEDLPDGKFRIVIGARP